MERKQLEKILDGYFIFNQWSRHHEASKESMNDLGEFMYIQILDSFSELYNTDYKYEYDFEFLDIEIDPNTVLTDPEEFEKFWFIFDDFIKADSLTFYNTGEPIILAKLKNTGQAPDRIVVLSDIKTEADLIEFLNDVLWDIGETTHPIKGNQQVYTVVKIAE